METGSEPVLVGKGNIHSPERAKFLMLRRNGSDLPITDYPKLTYSSVYIAKFTDFNFSIHHLGYRILMKTHALAYLVLLSSAFT